MPTTANGLVYPSTSAAPNVPADIQALANSTESFFGGTTAIYTSTLGWTNTTSVTTQTKLGNWVIVEFLLTLTGAPTGTFSFTLPSTAVVTAGKISCGTAFMLDTSATTNNQTGTVLLLTSTTATIYCDQDATAAIITPTNPFTFASGDTIGGTLFYRE